MPDHQTDASAPAPRGRPAPLILVVDPSQHAATATPGSYAAVAASGQALLAGELSRRFGALGAAVVPLRPEPSGATPFHWGRWFARAARAAVADAGGARLDAIGYAGGGALALLSDESLDALLSPVAGEVVANNRFSADAFVVAFGSGGAGATAATATGAEPSAASAGSAPWAGSPASAASVLEAIEALEACPTDNGAPRALEAAGFTVRDLAGTPFSRFDVDTPLDLALLRLATRLGGSRAVDGRVTSFLEMAALPGGRSLEVPRLAELGAVMRDRAAELVVAGRIPAATWQHLESETACRIRAFVEERGMRSARGARPRSLLARWLEEHGPAGLIGELSRLGDGVVLDSRVLMAALSGSSDAAGWPPEEERFASDFGDAGRISTPWLAELTAAAATASVPVVMGGHSLVSDGLRLIVAAAWQGR
jgi:hypothetical protein